MPVVKILDLLFELNLCCSQGLNLHKLLKIEESLRHRKLIAAATARQERLEFSASW